LARAAAARCGSIVDQETDFLNAARSAPSSSTKRKWTSGESRAWSLAFWITSRTRVPTVWRKAWVAGSPPRRAMEGGRESKIQEAAGMGRTDRDSARIGGRKAMGGASARVDRGTGCRGRRVAKGRGC
jgi:hypothetical protein